MLTYLLFHAYFAKSLFLAMLIQVQLQEIHPKLNLKLKFSHQLSVNYRKKLENQTKRQILALFLILAALLTD